MLKRLQTLGRRSTINTTIRINEAIRAENLRVIGPDGDQLGIMTRAEALKVAEEAGVDLIEISPNADPPVVKVVDWGKYQYQKMKELQKNRKNAKVVELKQMRMGLKIGANDLVVFRGREMAHQELGYEMINRIADQLTGETGDAILEQKPQMAGRNLSIVIRSK
jgi:translation initiation factor IF-3